MPESCLWIRLPLYSFEAPPILNNIRLTHQALNSMNLAVLEHMYRNTLYEYWLWHRKNIHGINRYLPKMRMYKIMHTTLNFHRPWLKKNGQTTNHTAAFVNTWFCPFFFGWPTAFFSSRNKTEPTIIPALFKRDTLWVSITKKGIASLLCLKEALILCPFLYLVFAVLKSYVLISRRVLYRRCKIATTIIMCSISIFVCTTRLSKRRMTQNLKYVLYRFIVGCMLKWARYGH